MIQYKQLYPTKLLRTPAAVEEYAGNLAHEICALLGIAGYKIYIYMPGTNEWHKADDAAMSIRVEYPYKKICISVQKDTLEKCATAKLSSGGYWDSFVHGMIHEIIHVILWDLMEVARARVITKRELDDVEEKTTDHIANVIHKMLRHSQ